MGNFVIRIFVNALALSAICNSYHGILCHPVSHVETDEANAPEFFTGGAKLIHVGGNRGVQLGKIRQFVDHTLK